MTADGAKRTFNMLGRSDRDEELSSEKKGLSGGKHEARSHYSSRGIEYRSDLDR
jgi:hypothetical protein